MALACLALWAGRAPAQDDFGPAQQPALPSSETEQLPQIITPSTAAEAAAPVQELPAAPATAPAQDDFGPARQLAEPPPEVAGPSAAADTAAPAPEQTPGQFLFRPAVPAQSVPAAAAGSPESVPAAAEPAAAPGSGLQAAALQQPLAPLPPGEAAPEETTSYHIQLEPPGPERLFRVDSEARLQERIRQEGRNQTPIDIVTFPVEPVLSKVPYLGRAWPPAHECAEANYLCYRRLLYEQKNFERYGWDLGIITPFVSALDFYADFVLMPYHGFSDPCRCHECSAGYCLPGDPVPYLLYPCEPSVPGALAEAGAVAAVLAIFP